MHPHLLFWGFFLGLAGNSFRSASPSLTLVHQGQQQGLALGIFRARNIGQSIAVFGAPLLVTHFGLAMPFWLFGRPRCCGVSVVLLFAQPPPGPAGHVTLSEALWPLRAQPLAWLFRPLLLVSSAACRARDNFRRSEGGVHLTRRTQALDGRLVDRPRWPAHSAAG